MRIFTGLETNVTLLDASPTCKTDLHGECISSAISATFDRLLFK